MIVRLKCVPVALMIALPATLFAGSDMNGASCAGQTPIAVLTYGFNSSSAHVIDVMPAYNWYHGCGPTAAASVIGYWDMHGYPNLFDASGKNVFLTANVQDQISSPAHNAKYDPDPDIPGPVPSFTSIADWFQTSVNQPLGWSWFSQAPAAFSGYAQFRGYRFEAQNRVFGMDFSWGDLVSEINANHPLMFLVDTDGDGSTDHFVPVLGYDDRGSSGKYYGLYTTWSEEETLVWEPFQGAGNEWGIYGATIVDPISAPVPELPPLFIGAILLGALAFVRRSFASVGDGVL